MARTEFSNPTKRAAWNRSGGICEGVGEMYGLAPGIRCTWDLKRGVQYDHDDPDANSRDNSLENCVCLCPRCHLHKTSKRDRPLIAKSNHMQDKARGIKKGRGFAKPPPGYKFSWRTGRMERLPCSGNTPPDKDTR